MIGALNTPDVSFSLPEQMRIAYASLYEPQNVRSLARWFIRPTIWRKVASANGAARLVSLGPALRMT